MSHVGQAAAEPHREAEGGFLSLMRHRNYALLWTGQLISQTGDRLQWVVISLWVYAQTGSALSVSYAIMALMLGPAIVGVFAGALVDRLDRRKILIYGDLLRAALVFAIPDLMNLGLIWLYIDLFLISSVSAFFRPAMFAVIPQSVPSVRLLQANAFFASMDTSTEVIGPALAGLVSTWRGYAAGIYVNGLSYLISAVFSSGLQLGRLGPADSVQRRGDAGGIIKSVKGGLTYIRDDQVQIAFIALLLGGGWAAGLNSLQTPLAKGALSVSDGQFAWYQSIWGIGFVLGSILIGWYGRRLPRGKTLVFAYLMWALTVGVLGLSVNYGMLVVGAFWVGFASMLMFVTGATLLMEHTPSDKLGRTLGTRQIVISIVRATALVGFGWLADVTNIRAAILAMAAISLVGTIGATIRFPTLWYYGREGLLEADVSPTLASQASSVGSPLEKVMHRLRAHNDREFIISEQLRLNAAVLSIVFLGWLALLTVFPVQALGILVSITVTVAAGALIRPIRRRLRAHAEGQERGGRKPER